MRLGFRQRRPSGSGLKTPESRRPRSAHAGHSATAGTRNFGDGSSAGSAATGDSTLGSRSCEVEDDIGLPFSRDFVSFEEATQIRLGIEFCKVGDQKVPESLDPAVEFLFEIELPLPSKVQQPHVSRIGPGRDGHPAIVSKWKAVGVRQGYRRAVLWELRADGPPASSLGAIVVPDKAHTRLPGANAEGKAKDHPARRAARHEPYPDHTEAKHGKTDHVAGLLHPSDVEGTL